MQYQSCKAQSEGVGSWLQKKVGRHILDLWFQDESSREKVKLCEPSGESAEARNELEELAKVVA